MSKTPKTAVVLINVGTPDKPETGSVRRYLFQFLNDRRVIDLPLILQKILVNLIIVPFRAPKSTKLYKLLWDDRGFPLHYYTEELSRNLQEKMGSEYEIFYAMRYGNPGLKELLKRLEKGPYSEIVFVPLFPQYASSTTGSVSQMVLSEISKWYIIPQVRFIDQFYRNPGFIEAFAKRIASYKPEDYDHIIFSYHGLPLDHIRKSHPDIPIESCQCEKTMPAHGEYCYKAACYETTRLIASSLNLSKEKYSVAFQSRLTKNWLMPFTDQVVEEKAKSGMKNMLIAAPAFVTDCLETIVELEMEYGDLFRKSGGEKLTLVRSLNDSYEWIGALAGMVR